MCKGANSALHRLHACRLLENVTSELDAIGVLAALVKNGASTAVQVPILPYLLSPKDPDMVVGWPDEGGSNKMTAVSSSSSSASSFTSSTNPQARVPLLLPRSDVRELTSSCIARFGLNEDQASVLSARRRG